MRLFGGVSVHCDSWVSSNFSIEVLLPEENISQLRLMYQALLDPTGGLTGPHVVLGEKKRNTVHTLARLSSSQEPRRRSRLLMISTSATHGKWIMLNAAGWNSRATRIYESNTHEVLTRCCCCWPDITHTLTIRLGVSTVVKWFGRSLLLF